MRSIWRTLDRGLARDIGLVCLADCLVGVSYGAIAVSSGFPFWLPMLMSLLVFAGASQFMFIGIVAAGGNPFAAVLAGLLANARHLPFGLAVGDIMGRGTLTRLVGAHLLIDESVAFAMAQKEPARARAVFWFLGTCAFVMWNIGTILGAAAGQVIGDPDVFGLDAAFPAGLLALVLPSLKNARTRNAALLGAAVALAATPFLPAGIPVLLALVGLAVLIPVPTTVAA